MRASWLTSPERRIGSHAFHGFSSFRSSAALGLAICMASLLLAGQAAGQDEIAVPRTLEVGPHKLVLNGAGIRQQMFVDAYLACLYVLEPGDDAQQILDADQPQAITLHMTSDMVNGKRLEDSALAGLKRSTGGNLEPIRAEIDQLRAMFDAEVRKGDVFTLAYLPDQGLSIHHNERYVGTIRGKRFARALFGIWLSERPVQKSLKRELLNGVDDH